MSEQPSQTTTLLLKDLKNRLPIELDKKQNIFFEFKDWTFKEEEFIAKAKSKASNIGRFITEVLNHMLLSVGDHDFTKLDKNEKILYLARQPMGNVLYMYIYLRYDQLGEELRLAFKCPHCGHNVDNYITDIGDLDIDCKFGQFDEVVKYKLRKPVTLEAGDQLIEYVNLGIARWSMMEQTDGSMTDDASMKKYSYKHSIVGVDGITGYVNTDEIIGKLKKQDIERLGVAIAKHNAGPSIQAEISCPKCSNTFWRQIDWSYDHFFGVGSLPQN